MFIYKYDLIHTLFHYLLCLIEQDKAVPGFLGAEPLSSAAESRGKGEGRSSLLSRASPFPFKNGGRTGELPCKTNGVVVTIHICYTFYV